MFYLGQAVAFKPYVNSAPLPAIITGYTQTYLPIITLIKDGEIIVHKQVYQQDLHLIRIKDKTSPSKASTFFGKRYKRGFIAPVKLKTSEDDPSLLEELKLIKEKIEEEL